MRQEAVVIVENATRQAMLAERGKRASSFVERGLGLMFTRSLEPGSCLVIDPCSSIHMFGMRYPIDVLYVDREHQVVRTQEMLKPWRIGPLHTRGAKYVIELPAGTIRETNTQVGDQLRLAERS